MHTQMTRIFGRGLRTRSRATARRPRASRRRTPRACALGLVHGLALAFASPTRAAAGDFADWLRSLTEWDGFEALERPVAGPWRELLADSDAARTIQGLLGTTQGALAVLALLACVVGAIWAVRARRATGEFTLLLDFPDDVDGEFDVRLRRRGGALPGRARSAHRRSGVRRETQLDRILPGEWTLEIDGLLRARGAGATLARVEERVDLTITPGRGASITHTLPAIEAPVEFRVHWDRQPAGDVGLGRSDRPETVRYASAGLVRTRLPLGRHDVVIGSGDRVVERACEITGFEPSVVRVDLASPEGLVFKGCPPAVSPFLQGDLAGAARALERDGQADVAALLRARLHTRRGETERAAEALEHAGRPREAALLRREISDFDRAAHLFEDAGELRAAAEMYDAAGAWAEAARAYAALEDWDAAARCFESGGDAEGLVGALEAQGEIFRAAALATESGDRARSIRLLQQIGPNDESFLRAGELLALAYEQEGHLDLAAHQLERCLDALPAGEYAPQLEFQLSELLEECGETTRALGVLETLRDREPTFPGVAARIENLRKLVSNVGPETAPAAFTPPPGATAFVADQRYEILEEIGRGGMGLVYKARDRRLDRTVALKRMPESLRDHPKAVQLFLGEAQAAARMNHPNIVTLYDADQEHGHFFITMELLDGLPLNTILEERTRFGPRDTARLGLQICAGLQYAHDAGIVHRDIKTSNLFVTRDRVLKIMDFGLAKILDAMRDGRQTLVAGTPFYMAPEQGTGAAVDARTDLYALGVTLFELSTGRLPFAEGDVARSHREAARPDPAEGLPDYPASLAQLIRALMSIDPDERPASADAVATGLQAVVDGR